jgi:putative FmdB family regulatory protein
MPIYEYTCVDCGAQFEKFVRSIAAGGEIECPECGGIHTKKGWSIFGTKSTGGLGSLATSSASSCNTGGT